MATPAFLEVELMTVRAALNDELRPGSGLDWRELDTHGWSMLASYRGDHDLADAWAMGDLDWALSELERIAGVAP